MRRIALLSLVAVAVSCGGPNNNKDGGQTGKSSLHADFSMGDGVPFDVATSFDATIVTGETYPGGWVSIRGVSADATTSFWLWVLGPLDANKTYQLTRDTDASRTASLVYSWTGVVNGKPSLGYWTSQSGVLKIDKVDGTAVTFHIVGAAMGPSTAVGSLSSATGTFIADLTGLIVDFTAATGVVPSLLPPLDPMAASPAMQVSQVSFSRPVGTVAPAGDWAFALYADKDFHLYDLSNAASPVVSATIATPARVVAIDHDANRGLGFALSVDGTVTAVNMASALNPTVLSTYTFTGMTPTAGGFARVGTSLFALNGATIATAVFNGSSFAAGPSLTLTQAATRITSGGGYLYVTYSNGNLEVWGQNASGVWSALGNVSLGGETFTLQVKGTRVIAFPRGKGMRIIDFAVPSAPSFLYSDSVLHDVSSAQLVGRMLVTNNDRGWVTTIDLSNFAAPRVVTNNTGMSGNWVAPVGGNFLTGSAMSGTVSGVAPYPTATIPVSMQNSFPLNGQIPVTFSKAIDASTMGAVTLTCGGVTIQGTTRLLPNGVTLWFTPSKALTASTACTLDFSGVKDTLGLSLAAAGSSAVLNFRTAAAPPAPVVNAGSKYAHTADGKFTDWTEKSTPAQWEWFDVKPAKGMYTYFYADFDGTNLWILNDWFHSGDKVDPDCYNQFNAWTKGGAEQWDIRAYGDQHVEVRKNGAQLNAADAGIAGGAGFGASPNVSDPHTIYEIRIPAGQGQWGVQLHDPGPSFHCSKHAADPTPLAGAMGMDGGSSPSTSVNTTSTPNAPGTIELNTAVGQQGIWTLSWLSQDRWNDFVQYVVYVSSSPQFSPILWGQVTPQRTATVPASVVARGGTFYWRVTAWNQVGTSTSSTGSFVVSVPQQDGGMDAGQDGGSDGGRTDAGSGFDGGFDAGSTQDGGSDAGSVSDAGFSFASVGSLVLWLHADQNAVNTLNGYVTSWVDSSGNNHHAFGPDAGWAPAFVNGQINGLPVVRFDGVDDFLDLQGQIIGKQTFTVIVVGKMKNAATQGMLLSNYATTNTTTSVYFGSGGGYLTFTADLQLGGNYTSNNYAIFTATSFLFNAQTFINGAVSGTRGAALNTKDLTTHYVLGRQGGTASGYLDGDIAEVLVFDKPLTSQEQAQVETALAAKYGLPY